MNMTYGIHIKYKLGIGEGYTFEIWFGEYSCVRSTTTYGSTSAAKGAARRLIKTIKEGEGKFNVVSKKRIREMKKEKILVASEYTPD